MNTSAVTAYKREHQRHIVIERIALKVSVMLAVRRHLLVRLWLIRE